jgi:hypothetical protein
MDFWDSGIYVVIIIIAFSFVMLSIMLMSKTIRQKGKRIYKRKDVYQETAGAEEEEKHQLPLDSVPQPPAVEDMNTSQNTNVAEALSVANIKSSAAHKLPASKIAAPKVLESVALVPEGVETEEGTGTGTGTEINTNTDAGTDMDSDTDADEIETGDSDDPMGIFKIEETEERALTGLAEKLPDVNVNNLFEECTDVVKMLRAKSNMPE